MIIECILAILSLLAVAVVYNEVVADGALTASPPNIFAQGIATMVTLMTGQELGASVLYKIVFTLLTLAVSVFALTSLDTGTRLGRYLFTELFLPWIKERRPYGRCKVLCSSRSRHTYHGRYRLQHRLP